MDQILIKTCLDLTRYLNYVSERLAMLAFYAKNYPRVLYFGQTEKMYRFLKISPELCCCLSSSIYNSKRNCLS